MSAPRSPGRVHAALVLVQVAFASLAVEGKLAMDPAHGVAPAALAMARIAGTAVVFVAAHLALRTPRVHRWSDVGRLALLSLFGVVLNQALFLRGLHLTSPLAATLLVATIPVFTPLIAAAAGRDRFGARTGVGLALAVFGVAILSDFATPHAGDTLVLVNAACYSVYVVFARGVLERYGTVTVVAWVFGVGAVMFAPFGGLPLLDDAPRWSGETRALVAFVVLVPTIVAYSVNAWAMARARPGLVTIYVYLQPLVVAVLAWAQLGQPLAPRVVAAGLAILAGVGVVASGARNGAAPAKAGLAASPPRGPY